MFAFGTVSYDELSLGAMPLSALSDATTGGAVSLRLSAPRLPRREPRGLPRFEPRVGCLRLRLPKSSTKYACELDVDTLSQSTMSASLLDSFRSVWSTSESAGLLFSLTSVLCESAAPFLSVLDFFEISSCKCQTAIRFGGHQLQQTLQFTLDRVNAFRFRSFSRSSRMFSSSAICFFSSFR